MAGRPAPPRGPKGGGGSGPRGPARSAGAARSSGFSCGLAVAPHHGTPVCTNYPRSRRRGRRSRRRQSRPRGPAPWLQPVPVPPPPARSWPPPPRRPTNGARSCGRRRRRRGQTAQTRRHCGGSRNLSGLQPKAATRSNVHSFLKGILLSLRAIKFTRLEYTIL